MHGFNTRARSYSFVHIFWAIFAATVRCGEQQFCHVDDKVDLCFAAATSTSPALNSDDLYLTISSKFTDREGWAGIGVGQHMPGALLLVMYPGEEAEDVTLSVRTTNLYTTPHLATKSEDGVPDIKKLTTSVVNDTFTVSLVCHSCNLWPNSNFSATSTEQGFIWATHWTQPVESNDIGHSIRFHPRMGTVQMNMLEARSFGQIPQVFSPRVSSKGVRQEVHRHEHTHSHTAWRIHGTLLSIAFMLLFPLGTVTIRTGVSKSFTYHWIIQATAASIVFAGVGIGVWKVVSGHGFSGLLRTHQLIGLMVLLSMPMQMVFGNLHHQFFMRHSRRTGVSYAHIYLGRVVILAGMANVGVGLNKAGAGTEYCAVWISVMLLELGGWVLWWWMNRAGKWPWDSGKGKYKRMDDAEHGE